VLIGTGTGIYETKDGAASWQLINETEGFGGVISFAETTIGGKQYISCTHGSSISSVPVSGGLWQTAESPAVLGYNGQMSTVTTAGKSEVVACINGGVRYGAFDTPTHIEWTDPLNYTQNLFVEWSDPSQYNHQSYVDFWDSCPKFGLPKDCKGHWHWVPCNNDSVPPGGPPHCPPDGSFRGWPNEGKDGCQSAVINGTDLGFKPAAYLQKGSIPYMNYSMHCFASDNFATWAPPQAASQWDNQTTKDDIGQSYCGRGIGSFPVNSTEITCTNAAVDPNDRNHFMYSEPKTNYNWDSHDGGATVRKMGFTGDNSNGTGNHNHGTFYVAIDGQGWSYCASQGGAFVSRDNVTASFSALHMVFTPRGNAENATEWPLINRVNHDYQGISTMFRGDSVAFPSDQGLGILDGDNNVLINAIGDMHNSMALSALISPSKDGKSRNIVVNLWDWNQAFTIDDGATWRGWATSEAAPYTCGEGGWGFSLGKSGHVLMFHHSGWWYSSDGGYNFVQNTFPGSGGLGMAYVRQAGSLTEPNGTVFSLMTGPAGPSGEFLAYSKSKAEREHEEHVQEKLSLSDPNYKVAADPSVYTWLLTSENFGLNFTYTVLPDKLQTCGGSAALGADPTTPNSLYFLSENCLAHSTDYGISWSSCIVAPGLEGPFIRDSGAMIVKNKMIMFVMRVGKVPLKTVDGGATWKPMTSLASLYQGYKGAPPQQQFKGELSWTGKTLVVYGIDRTAIQRHEFGTKVWKSSDDGETWTDETGDMATISLGHGRWYESDFYIVTQGSGVIAKRNFE